jgi:23S rRNA (cytidine1920-2'-O)/16S rRNA (cytidine1409-2'-O)-methyltransferase
MKTEAQFLKNSKLNKSLSNRRLDLVLVERGLAKSRSQAQQLIKNGAVEIDGELITKSSFEVHSEISKIEIKDPSLVQFVSRGGLKLQGALKHTGYSVKGLTVLDVGISTGGFTDCLLQNGVEKVVGIDVGHGQLDPRLAKDSRIVHFEGLNARQLDRSRLGPNVPLRGFELIVIDVSFVSLELVLPSALPFLSENGRLLCLVKPQFEAGRKYLGKTGVIRDVKAFEEVKEKIYKICDTLKLRVEDYFESQISGTDGNQEFFLFASHKRLRED